MLKLDTQHVTDVFKTTQNFTGYHEICHSVLSIFRMALLKDVNFIPVDSAFINSNISLWRRVTLQHPVTHQLKFVLLVFLDVNSKKVYIFQFSYDDSEALRLVALFTLDFRLNKLLPKYGWSFLIDNEQKPYSIGDFATMFIDPFLDEIKFDLIKTLNNL